MWNDYKRKGFSEMRPFLSGENLNGISVSREDAEAGSPKEGDMIARNPKNHKDQWLVAAKYFNDNLELVETSDDCETEKEIVAKGLTAPRLTPEAIEATIVYAEYARVTNTTCTICSLVLQNGYVVIGKSAAVSMENFDEDLGKRLAKADAQRQIWALEGYLLKQRLLKEGTSVSTN